MSFGDYIITEDISIQDTLSIIENNIYKVLFITKDGNLNGVVTDGDIRRFLLSGKALTEAVRETANFSPIFVEGFHEEDARRLLNENMITCVPMTENGHIHALVFLEETIHEESAEACNAGVIIMAGGLGTRLQPYTSVLPKALIPVGSRTMTEQIIERFKKFGCREFSLVVNHKKSIIKAYFAETAPEVEITLIEEDEPLGTGGGLWLFKNKINSPVFVVNCDSVVEANYAEILKMHERDGNAVTMVAASQDIEIPYGVINLNEDGSVGEMQEKPTYSYLMNTGFYVVGPEFLEEVQDNKFQAMTEIIENCKKSGKRIGAYVIKGDCFIDIGQMDELSNLGGKLR